MKKLSLSLFLSVISLAVSAQSLVLFTTNRLGNLISDSASIGGFSASDSGFGGWGSTGHTNYWGFNASGVFMTNSAGTFMSNGLGIFSLGETNQQKLLFDYRAGIISAFSSTNGVAPPPSVMQPIVLFGSMMMSTSTNTVTVGSSGTYYVLTNYQTLRTNGFGANGFTGYLTNTVAGFYRLSYYITAVPGNGNTLESEVQINGIGKEEISCFHTYDTPARTDALAASGVLYIPAGASIALTLNNRSAASNITVWRAGLTVGTP